MVRYKIYEEKKIGRTFHKTSVHADMWQLFYGLKVNFVYRQLSSVFWSFNKEWKSNHYSAREIKKQSV